MNGFKQGTGLITFIFLKALSGYWVENDCRVVRIGAGRPVRMDSGDRKMA